MECEYNKIHCEMIFEAVNVYINIYRQLRLDYFFLHIFAVFLNKCFSLDLFLFGPIWIPWELSINCDFSLFNSFLFSIVNFFFREEKIHNFSHGNIKLWIWPIDIAKVINNIFKSTKNHSINYVCSHRWHNSIK